MMRYEKWYCRLGALLLAALAFGCLLFAFTGERVLAEESEDVTVTVVAEPEELSASEPVTLTFTVSNYSEYELSNIAIYHDTVSYTVEGMEDYVIPPGGSGIYPLTVEYPDSWIGLPVDFTVSYLKYAEPYSHTVTVLVERTEDPVIGLIRTVSATQARQGDTVTVTYELINDTKFDMEDITLIDEEVSDNAIFRNHALNAGNRVTQTHTYIMGDADVVSAPVITYDVNGKTKSFSAVEPVTVSLVDPKLSLQVETGTPAATGVPFVLTVRNEGNIVIENISLYDDRGQAVQTGVFSLEPGEEQAISFTVIPTLTESVRNVTFTLYGVDGMGNAYEYAAPGSYPVYPFVDDAQLNVTLKADCVSDWDATSGAVRVRFTVLNYSDVVLTNARVTEEQIGTLATYGELITGSTVFEQELPLTAPRNLNFSVYAYDPAGTERLVAAFTLTVNYPAETATPIPETTPEPETTDATGDTVETASLSFSDTLLRIIIIVGAVLAIGFIALIVLAVLEHQKSGGISADFYGEEDEDEDETGDGLIDMSLVERSAPKEKAGATQTRALTPAGNGNTSHGLSATETRPLRTPTYDRPREAADYIRIASERRAHFEPRRYTPQGTAAEDTFKTKVMPTVTPAVAVPKQTETERPKPAPEKTAPAPVTERPKFTLEKTGAIPVTERQKPVVEKTVTQPTAEQPKPVSEKTAPIALPEQPKPALENATDMREETAPLQKIDGATAPRRVEGEYRPAVRAVLPDTPRHVSPKH